MLSHPDWFHFKWYVCVYLSRRLWAADMWNFLSQHRWQASSASSWLMVGSCRWFLLSFSSAWVSITWTHMDGGALLQRCFSVNDVFLSSVQTKQTDVGLPAELCHTVSKFLCRKSVCSSSFSVNAFEQPWQKEVASSWVRDSEFPSRARYGTMTSIPCRWRIRTSSLDVSSYSSRHESLMASQTGLTCCLGGFLSYLLPFLPAGHNLLQWRGEHLHFLLLLLPAVHDGLHLLTSGKVRINLKLSELYWT